MAEDELDLAALEAMEERDAYLPTPTPPDLGEDDGTRASGPGMIPLSMKRLQTIAPFHFTWMKFIGRLFRFAEKADADQICRALWYGDSNPAFLMSRKPVIVAAYAADIDTVVLLDFEDDDLEHLDLRVGDRLLSVNTYGETSDGQVVRDLVPGEGYTGYWQNFQPHIADLLSDYHGRIARRKAEIPEALWQRARELAEIAMALPERTLRLGNPVMSYWPA